MRFFDVARTSQAAFEQCRRVAPTVLKLSSLVDKPVGRRHDQLVGRPDARRLAEQVATVIGGEIERPRGYCSGDDRGVLGFDLGGNLPNEVVGGSLTSSASRGRRRAKAGSFSGAFRAMLRCVSVSTRVLSARRRSARRPANRSWRAEPPSENVAAKRTLESIKTLAGSRTVKFSVLFRNQFATNLAP